MKTFWNTSQFTVSSLHSRLFGAHTKKEEAGKLNEAIPLWRVEQKNVRHFMNKQSSVCSFLQMVGFPPPHFFFVPNRCAPHCLIPLAHQAPQATVTVI